MSKHYIAFLLFLLPLAITAQEMVTDRPDQTESPVSLSKGAFQLESGMMLEVSETERNWILNTSLFRYGVSRNLELRLVSGLENNRPRVSETNGTTGIGDIQLGVKYQFLRGKTEGAYMGHLILPTGTREVSEGTIGMDHRLAFGHQVTDWFGVAYNAGVTYYRSQGLDGTWSLSLGFGLTDRIGFFSEVYGTLVEFQKVDVRYDHGFTILLRPDLQLDISMGTGITSRSNFYSFGASWYVPYQD